MVSPNARLGLVLFAVYVVFYTVFVMVSAFAPQTMEATPFGGVSLAITSGAALIALAMVLAAIYGVLAKNPKDSEAQP
ncbi:DUF485 domain-containing protein [Botrimarina hoheduenensis]|uniref:Inner membrane protein YjcH n=1 Tax=Botrimarina hoheduenensis TaxID=2528000 RepID=A0A5C5WC09_9BACT|nr:DUF485 domain-containing protein [Botrimarina hoheduenensis]TWT48438.1 hypothetical protein Pla111_02060 [Botrimarina hoheduenensis]